MLWARAVCALIPFLLSTVAFALPRAEMEKGTVLSYAGYYDARIGGRSYPGVDLLLSLGVKSNFSIGLTYTYMSGHGETARVGGFFLAYEVIEPLERNSSLSILGGFKYRSASASGRWTGASGFEIGAVGDLKLTERASAHLRLSSVAYEDRTWLEVEFGLSLKAHKNLFFDLGYKSYRHSGGTLGGFVASLVFYRHPFEPW